MNRFDQINTDVVSVKSIKLFCNAGSRRLNKISATIVHKLSAQKKVFIALIHPIQWTIALPVGATGPAKRQKKTSCI